MKRKLEKEFNKYDWGESFKVIAESDCFYGVVFSKCVFRFYINKMYSSVECVVYDKKNIDEYYTLEEALEYNGQKSSDVYWNQSNVTEEEYIEQYVNILHTRLFNIIEGDFEWIKKIKQIRFNTDKIQKALGTTLVFDTEVYKKMISGDENWENDLLTDGADL